MRLRVGRRLGTLVLTCSILVALFALGFVAPSGVAAFEDQEPSLGLHDEAGVLTEEKRALIEERIDEVEASGAPTVVYLRIHDADVDETIADARDLMEQWNVQSVPDARDGFVMFLNLDTDDPEHGSLALVAGRTHVESGTLSESRLDDIRDDMTELLADGEMGEGIALGLNQAAEYLQAGPPEPSALEEFVAGIADSPLNIFNIVALLVAGAIGYTSMQAWSKRPRVPNAVEHATTSAPGTFHPAYAGALASGRVNNDQVEATILELARRGALVIEPDPTETKKERAQIRITDESVAQYGFEQELMNVLVNHSQDGVINHKELSKLRGDWGGVQKVLRRDMEQLGWFNPDAGSLRKPFYIGGAVGILLAAITVVAVVISGELWPLIGAVILGVVGLAALIFGSLLPSTTREGEEEAIPWRGYRTGLQHARDSSYGEVDLDEAFPYIVAMSMAAKYEKHLERASQSGYVPKWLGPREEEQYYFPNWHVYWIAWHTAIAPTDSSSSSYGGAAAGSGASGGRF